MPVKGSSGEFAHLLEFFDRDAASLQDGSNPKRRATTTRPKRSAAGILVTGSHFSAKAGVGGGGLCGLGQLREHVGKGQVSILENLLDVGPHFATGADATALDLGLDALQLLLQVGDGGLGTVLRYFLLVRLKSDRTGGYIPL